MSPLVGSLWPCGLAGSEAARFPAGAHVEQTRDHRQPGSGFESSQVMPHDVGGRDAATRRIDAHHDRAAIALELRLGQDDDDVIDAVEHVAAETGRQAGSETGCHDDALMHEASP